jgi:molybdopterin molybdotransferase
LLFGLPGNPVSVFVTFEVFVRPALRRLAGRTDTELLRPVDVGVLEEPVTKAVGRRAFLRVAALRDPRSGAPIRDAAGRVRVRLAGGQESHQLAALAAADSLAVVPESVTGLPAGAGVELWWLDRP